MRINPNQMKRYMKQLGIKTEEWNDVEEVIFKRKGGNIVVRNPSVIVVDAQGQKIIQVSGDILAENNINENVKYSEDDIKIVMEQTGVSREEAIKALEESNGEVAKAILKLIGG